MRRARLLGEFAREIRRRPGAAMGHGIAIALLLIPFGLGVWRSARLIRQTGPAQAIPDEIAKAIARIDRELPPEAPIFYICDEREKWFSRLWQRALFPRPVFTIESEADLRSPRFDELRRKYGVRHAVSSGLPPLDPGFRTRAPLYEGHPVLRTAWWGELR